MDANFLHSISTVVVFIAFILVVLWAYSGNRKKDFEEASKLPLDDDSPINQNSQGKL
jgi:cytochrome c oxidase cbb3-type subunit 4